MARLKIYDTSSMAWKYVDYSTFTVPTASFPYTASWAITASFALNGGNGGTVLYTSQSQWSVSASYASSSTTAEAATTATTATTATNLGLTAYNISVTYASQSNWSVSSSYASSSTSAGTATTATTATNLGLTVYNISVLVASQSRWATSSSYASSSTTTNTNLIQNTASNDTSYLLFSLNTASYQNTYVTTSITVNAGLGRLTALSFTGSLLGNTTGTSSWANVAQGSFFASQSRWAISSSWASSSQTAVSAVSATSADSATSATTATNLALTAYNISVTHASQSRWATSSSYASSSLTSSFVVTPSGRTESGSVLVNDNGVLIKRYVDDGNAPLIVDYSGSSAAYIQKWQLNNTNKMAITIDGQLLGTGMSNLVTSNSGSLQTNIDGVLIYRNVADTNSSLTVNNNNIGSTGPIARFQFGGSSKSYISGSGMFVGTSSWAESASWAPGGNGITGGSSYNISASWASASVSSSHVNGIGGTVTNLTSSHISIGLTTIKSQLVDCGGGNIQSANWVGSLNPWVDGVYAMGSNTVKWSTFGTKEAYCNNISASLITSSYVVFRTGSGAWRQYVDFTTGNLVFTYS